MRLNASLALCLLGAVSNAIPTPQEETPASSLPSEASPDETQAQDQLEQLAQFASQTTNDTISQNEKRGGCSLWSLSVRREW